MSSSSSQASIGLLFDVQALNRLNENERKQDEKRKHEVKSNEIAIQTSDKDDDKLKKKRSDGKDVLSRRRNVVRAMMKRASKNGKSSKKAKTQDSPIIAKNSKASKTSKTAKTGNGKNTGKTGKKNAFNKAQIKGLGLVFNQLTKIQLRAQAEEWPEPKLDLKKNVLDQVLDRKNLKDCKLSDKQLAKAKQKARGYSRGFRKMGEKVWKPALNSVANGYAKHGVDITNPEHKTNPDIDSSIFAAILDSIEVNQLLQKLGIKTEIVEMDFQGEMSKEVLSDSEKVYSKNATAIKKSHEHSCKQETLKILGDIFGAFMCSIGLPEVGIPMILAANGEIQKMILAVAKFMDVPAYVVQSIIMAITIIIAIIVDTVSLGSTTGLCVAAVLFVAGITGWLTNTVGAIATGQLDPSKFPGWVCWAVMGINIGMVLITCGESLMNLVSTIGDLLSTGASMAAEGLSNIASSAMESLSSVFGDTESLTSGMEFEMTDAANFGEDEISVIEKGTPSESSPATLASSASSGASETVNAVNEPSVVSGQSADAVSIPAMNAPTPAVSISMSDASGGVEAVEGAGGEAPVEGVAVADPAATGVSSSTGIVSGTSSDTASVMQNIGNRSAYEDLLGDEEEGTSASVGKTSAPTEAQAAQTEEAEEGTDTRTVRQKALDSMRKLFTKMLAKLVKMQRSIMTGLSEDAAEASAMTKGGESAAEKAESITQNIAKVMRILKKISRWMMLLDQGAQAIVEFEIAKCDDNLADTLKEIAQLTGETEIVEQFVATFNMAIKATKKNESEFAKDSSVEFALLGSVVSTQRRNNNMLMSA